MTIKKNSSDVPFRHCYINFPDLRRFSNLFIGKEYMYGGECTVGPKYISFFKSGRISIDFILF